MNFFLTILTCFWIILSCQKENEPIVKTNENSIFRTWVLIFKEKLNAKSTIKHFPTTEDTYPITLSFISSDQICGYHDANSYMATYSITDNLLSFTGISTTDVGDTEWYLDYIQHLSMKYKIKFSGNDTLKLTSQDDSLSIVLLKKQRFNETTFDVDSLYSYFSICQTDSSNIVNSLQGTSWVMLYTETYNIKDKETQLPPEDDDYPVILSIFQDDSIYGKHDANSYHGKCEINSNNFSLSNIFVTDVSDNDWYWDYIEDLSVISKSFVVNNDSLKLTNDDSSLILYFIDKELFNQNYFNVDSLYNPK